MKILGTIEVRLHLTKIPLLEHWRLLSFHSPWKTAQAFHPIAAGARSCRAIQLREHPSSLAQIVPRVVERCLSSCLLFPEHTFFASSTIGCVPSGFQNVGEHWLGFLAERETMPTQIREAGGQSPSRPQNWS